MGKLKEFLDNYVVEFDWKDIGMFKLCMCAFGIMIGVSLPKEKRKPIIVVCGIVFVTTTAVLFGKLLGLECPFCNKDEFVDWDGEDWGDEESGLVMKISAEE